MVHSPLTPTVAFMIYEEGTFKNIPEMCKQTKEKKNPNISSFPKFGVLFIFFVYSTPPPCYPSVSADSLDINIGSPALCYSELSMNSNVRSAGLRDPYLGTNSRRNRAKLDYLHMLDDNTGCKTLDNNSSTVSCVK